VGKMVHIGSNTTRNINDYHLSRYSCYLIAQNVDPRKKVIVLVQTRKQELLEQNYNNLSKNKKINYL